MLETQQSHRLVFRRIPITIGEPMNKTEMYRQQLRQLRSNFYAKDNHTIQEMMEFAQEEIYLVKKMSGKF